MSFPAIMNVATPSMALENVSEGIHRRRRKSTMRFGSFFVFAPLNKSQKLFADWVRKIVPATVDMCVSYDMAAEKYIGEKLTE